MRKHFITNLGWVTLTLLLFAVPPVLLSSFFGISFHELLGLNSRTVVAIIFSWYLFVIGFAFEQFMVWYFNLYIVTNHRVVDIDFYHLLYKTISAADLDDLEDVTFRMGGIFQAVFNYGDIELQTAGTVTQFEFHGLPHPASVQKTILELSKGSKKDD